jgi:ribosomal protein S18 acetylase RimI-like enzyme
LEIRKEKVIIRPAKYTDVDELSLFATKAFYDAYDWYNTKENMQNYVNEYFTPEKLRGEISDPDCVYLIAEENNKIIGYAKLGKMNNQTELKESHSEIERIYVDSSLQRMGTGRKLIEEIIRYAQLRGSEFIWLGVWQKNEKAVNFYKKYRFEIFGVTEFVLGSDVQQDFMMKLKI